MINRILTILNSIAASFNLIAAGAVIAIMTVIVLDVTLRYLRVPVPGAYDLVGLLGAVAISFALAHTYIQKGHISVEFLFNKLPERLRNIVTAFNEIVASLFFAIVSYTTAVFAYELFQGGEVSITIKMPTYPFIAGVSLSAALLSFILFFNFLKSLRWLIRK